MIKEAEKMTWEKFKAMPFKKKLEHIWDYYRWQILITLVVALALGTWITQALSQKDPVLQIEMVNAYGNSDGSSAFQDFLEAEGREYYEDAVIIGKNVQMNGPDPTQNYGAAQMLFCTVAAGEPDLIFWDTDQVIPILNGGPLLDLREVLPEELLKANEDRLVYGTYEEGGEPYPCGIYLERNPWIMEHKYYVNCTASVSVSCKDRALAADFLTYLLNAEG